MRTFLFLLFFSLLTFSSFSLKYSAPYFTNASLEFVYYIYISGVSQREDVISIQELIQKKEGVNYFMAERFPVRCFVLKSNKPISESEFKNWIPKKYEVIVFGEGNQAKEASYRIYNKNKKPKQNR